MIIVESITASLYVCMARGYIKQNTQVEAMSNVNIADIDPEKIHKRTYTEPPDTKSRIMGASLLITQVGVMVGYGLSGLFRNESSVGLDVLRHGIVGLMLMFIFACVGFGMLLNIYRFGNWLGSTSAIVILSVSIQLGPLLQKLWISIIITGFGDRNQNISTTTTATDFLNAITSSKIDVGVIIFRTVLLSVISSMTVMCAVVGRINLTQIIKFASMYQIFWNANYYLLVYFCVNRNDFNNNTIAPFFFDMFGTTYVYLFAVAFGIPFSCLITGQALPEVHPRNEFNRISLALSQIGTGFIAALFVFTSSFVINYNRYGNAVGENLGRFSIMFGIIGSIIGTFVGSAIVGGGRVGYKEVLTGSISGAVVMGSAAPIVTNIGIILMIGSVTGFLCGVYMRVLHVKINVNNVKDVVGLFGPFAISSLLGSLVVTPSVLSVYYNRGISFPFNNTVPAQNYASYQLIYVGITIAIGLIGGLFTVLMGICDKEFFALAANARVFINEFGLYDLGEGAKSLNVLPLNKNGTVAKLPTEANFLTVGESQQALNKSGALI